MPVRYFGIVILIFLFSKKAIADCESKTSVYFANGMFNDPEDAHKSLMAIQSRIAKSHSKWMGQISNWRVAYNTNESVLNQLWQVFDQKRNEISGNFWSHLLPLLERSENAAKRTHEILALFAENELKKDSDLKIQVNAYQNDINKRRRIVTFAHSQGNFYSLFAYDSLSRSEQPLMDIISVATPANRALENGYTTFDSDGVVTAIPDSLPSNMAKKTPGLFDHRFIEDYLDDERSLQAVFDDFKATMNNPPSDGLEDWPVTNSWAFDSSLEKAVGWVREYFKKPYPLEKYECLIVYELMYLRQGISKENCKMRTIREMETALDHCGQDLKGAQPNGGTACPFFGISTDMSVEALDFAELNPKCRWYSRSDFLRSGLTAADIEKAKAFLQKINR